MVIYLYGVTIKWNLCLLIDDYIYMAIVIVMDIWVVIIGSSKVIYI
jgi:hypothetical protein